MIWYEHWQRSLSHKICETEGMRAWIAQKSEQNNSKKNRFTNWENATCDERGNGRWVEMIRGIKWTTTKTNKTRSSDVTRPGKHNLKLSKNAAWGKTRVSWSLLEAPEKTGPVQSHDCSIAIAEGFLNSVVREDHQSHFVAPIVFEKEWKWEGCCCRAFCGFLQQRSSYLSTVPPLEPSVSRCLCTF